MSRDRLARSIEKFERLAHDAIENLELLRDERNEFEKRLLGLTRQVEDDRANSKHNEKLYESLQDDLKSQQTEIDSLQRKREDQEGILREQLQTIERLETELSQSSHNAKETAASASSKDSEVDTLKAALQALEDRITRTSQERDEIREQLYARERDDSQWAVKLTAEEHSQAEAELGKLVNRIDDIERQMTVAESGEIKRSTKNTKVEEAA